MLESWPRWQAAASLYCALDRLCADELIGLDREEIVDGGNGRLRQYYRLTPTGTERLSAEAARLRLMPPR